MAARLQDKVAVVTGGASGIGKAVVERLLADGARVVFGDLNLKNGTGLQDELARSGWDGRVRFFPCDVSQESDISHLIQFTRETFGRLDAMVNNAGTGGALTQLIDTSVEDWDRTQEVLVRGVFLGVKYAARAMIQQGEGGSIVNVASVAGLCGGAGGAAYSAAKAAVINLTRVAATQLGKYRIRCNGLCPGTILTPLLMRGTDPEVFRKAAVFGQPWPDPGEPDDVAPVVSFLCSEDSRFVTGEQIVVDGGMVAAGTNLYDGWHPLGQAITKAIAASSQTGFDTGSVQHELYSASRIPNPEELLTPAARQDKRTVVITGISRGLGRAMARQLIDLGHTVLGCARSADAIRECQSQFGAPHRFDIVDVSQEGAVRDWVASLESAGHGPDLLLCNAAIGNSSRQLWRFDSGEIEQVIQVNLLGTIYLIRQFIPGMFRRRKGIIVTFSSGWGRGASEKVAPYCASKWGVEGLTKALACELPPWIAAVALHPGIIQTETMSLAFGDAAGRYPAPEEWARVAAPFILGITPEDNGRSLTVPGMAHFHGMGRT